MSMIKFTSKREKSLWWWSIAVMAAILASLALGSILAPVLGNQTLAAWLFGTALLLVAITVIIHGLRIRPSGLEIAIVMGILSVYYMVFVRMTLVTERSHLIEYSVLAVFILEALNERKKNGKNVPLPWLMAIVITSLLGVIDEGIQELIPSRVMDPEDMLFNTLAAIMAVAGSSLLTWARRLVLKRKAKSKH